MPEWLKKFLLIIILVAVIAGSFWISFLIGKQMLLPARKLPSSLIPPQIKTEIIKQDLSDISIEVESETPPMVTAEIKPAPKPAEIKKKAVPVLAKSGRYKVQAGVFRSYDNAKNQAAALKKKGFSAWVSKYGSLWRVLAGTYDSSASAKKLVTSLKAAGFDAVVR